MALTIDTERPTWRYTAWRGPLQGLTLVVVGSLASLMVAGAVLNIDGTANAVHTNALQDLVGVVAFVLGIGIATVFVVLITKISRPTVVATSESGIGIYGLRRLTIPWSMVEAIRLGAPNGRGRTRRVPMLYLRTGAIVPVSRASSRFSAKTLATIDADGGDLHGSELPRRRAITITQALQCQLRAISVGFEIPPPCYHRTSGSSREAALPGVASFRMRTRDALPPQYRLGLYGLIVVGVERIAGSVIQAQTSSGGPFDLGLFLLTVILILLGVETLVLGLLLFATAEVAIGRDWVARRRYFHRTWAILSLSEVVSTSTRTLTTSARRRAAALPAAGPGLLLQSSTGRGLFISGRMLRVGAVVPLQAALDRSPSLFPSAASVLSGSALGGMPPPPEASPVSQARRAYGHAWGAMISFLMVGLGACVLAAQRHVLWVVVPVIAAVGPTIWLVVVRHRELGATKSGSGGHPIAVASAADAHSTIPPAWLMRFSQFGMAATIGSVALVAHFSNPTLAIAGAPGYSTYTGANGQVLAEGAPWGTSCEPLVFVAKDFPVSLYLPVERVIELARNRGMDVTMAQPNGDWNPLLLYPPGQTNSTVQFVPIYADATDTPQLSDGQPEHIAFGWDAGPDAAGGDARLTDLQATLYLKNVTGNPEVLRRSIRQLLAFAEGIGQSTAVGSGISRTSTRDSFSIKDIAAMQRMSGCNFKTHELVAGRS